MGDGESEEEEGWKPLLRIAEEVRGEGEHLSSKTQSTLSPHVHTLQRRAHRATTSHSGSMWSHHSCLSCFPPPPLHGTYFPLRWVKCVVWMREVCGNNSLRSKQTTPNHFHQVLITHGCMEQQGGAGQRRRHLLIRLQFHSLWGDQA